MPLIEVRLLKGRNNEQKKKLLEGITRAVQEAIGAPLSTIRVWIVEFSAENYMVGGELFTERKKSRDKE